MSALRDAAQQALEALEEYAPQHGNPDDMDAAITALRAVLAQQEQEQQGPVAWVDETSIAWLTEHPRGIVTTRLVSQKSPERQMPLYTHPPRREWQSLTDEDISLIDWEKLRTRKDAVRAIEAKLKEKNNG